MTEREGPAHPAVLPDPAPAVNVITEPVVAAPPVVAAAVDVPAPMAVVPPQLPTPIRAPSPAPVEPDTAPTPIQQIISENSDIQHATPDTAPVNSADDIPVTPGVRSACLSILKLLVGGQ